MLRQDAQMINIDASLTMDYYSNDKKEKKGVNKEWRTIEELPNGKIIYMRFGLPLMSERDNVCLI
jgi:hypothetical protein